MVTLGILWLPILLSALACWILNAVFWTASPHHKSDWLPLPDDGGILPVMRAAGLRQGMYYFPREKGPESARDPEARALLERGPSGYMIVERRGVASMGKAMLLAFVLNLAVASGAAYAASVGLAQGASYLDVFRLIATVVLLAYATERFSISIWFGHSWASTWKSTFDAVILALVSGGIFGWLWPQ